MENTRIFGVVLAVLLLLLPVALSAAGYGGFVYALHRPKQHRPAKPGKQGADPIRLARDAARSAAKKRFTALAPEDCMLQSADNTNLRAWFFPAVNPHSRRLVVFAHGYHNDGPGEFADQLAFYRSDMGFHCLFPDHRAHGRSGGKTIGFGAPEARDLLAWAQNFITRLGSDVEIVLHGISMGAATVLLCSTMHPPPQIKCVIADCGYTNALAQIRHTMRTELRLRFAPLLWVMELWARLLGKVSLRHASDPLGKMPNATLPALFIHGEEDSFVPFEMGKHLFAACPAEKDCLWIPGAAHAMCYSMDTPAYQNAVERWCKRYIQFEDPVRR
ncbi:MAG: lysophospholipase [Oscillospiraceae bacterium]|nr:lysophospholipase [Oscillospiraceae bacterium]